MSQVFRGLNFMSLNLTNAPETGQGGAVSKADRKRLRAKFLDWQCRLRQTAMRVNGGRPSPGMRPGILDEAERTLAPALTVLLVPKAPEEATAFFRFQVMKSTDPRETYEKALRYLQADYFQEPEVFSDRLVATLPGDALLVEALQAAKRCVLRFAEGRWGYRVPCKVRLLKADDADRAAAIWHNRVFNPQLPDTVHVVAFDPDWTSAQAEPGREDRETVSP